MWVMVDSVLTCQRPAECQEVGSKLRAAETNYIASAPPLEDRDLSSATTFGLDCNTAKCERLFNASTRGNNLIETH